MQQNESTIVQFDGLTREQVLSALHERTHCNLSGAFAHGHAAEFFQGKNFRCPLER